MGWSPADEPRWLLRTTVALACAALAGVSAYLFGGEFYGFQDDAIPTFVYLVPMLLTGLGGFVACKRSGLSVPEPIYRLLAGLITAPMGMFVYVVFIYKFGNGTSWEGFGLWTLVASLFGIIGGETVVGHIGGSMAASRHDMFLDGGSIWDDDDVDT